MLRISAIVIVLLLLFGAVIVQAQDEVPLELLLVDLFSTDGDVSTGGSSTVQPLSEAIGLKLKEQGYGGNFSVEPGGSGAGIAKFCNGELDIANSSRAMKQSEIDACRENDIEPLGFLVGLDGITVVAAKNNTFAKDLTLAQLGAIFSGQARYWSDVNPDWPHELIRLFTPGTDSGTFDFFNEKVLAPLFPDAEDPITAGEEVLLNLPDLQTSEDDNVIVNGVAQDIYALGFFGFSYFQENMDRLNAVMIDGIEPNATTVESGNYALSRPLYLYTSKAIMNTNPAVADILNFYLSNVSDVILDIGYFPASVPALNWSKAQWLHAMGMDDLIPPELLADLLAAMETTPEP